MRKPVPPSQVLHRQRPSPVSRRRRRRRLAPALSSGRSAPLAPYLSVVWPSIQPAVSSRFPFLGSCRLLLSLSLLQLLISGRLSPSTWTKKKRPNPKNNPRQRPASLYLPFFPPRLPESVTSPPLSKLLLLDITSATTTLLPPSPHQKHPSRTSASPFFSCRHLYTLKGKGETKKGKKTTVLSPELFCNPPRFLVCLSEKIKKEKKTKGKLARRRACLV